MTTCRDLQERIQESVRGQSAGVAASSARLWQSLSAELVGIIGEHGFQALYIRCLHKTRMEHAWLTARVDPDFATLHDNLVHQDAERAVAAATALLSTFCTTLIELIGESLTSMILQAAWDATFHVPATKGTPQ